MKNNVTKRGVSLIVLVITIVVMLILTSSILLSGDDSREVSRKAIFISDLKTIQDAIKEYYIMNGELPTYKKASVKSEFTKSEILSLNNDADLANQIDMNKDTNSKFYSVDLDVLSLENLGYGKKYNNSNSLDKFVVSYPNMKVYYLDGIKADDMYYYTLSEILTGQTSSTSISPGTDSSTTSISTQTSSGRIRVIRGNMSSNTLDLNVIAQLKSGENLSITINGTTSPITTKDGYNSVSTGENVVVLSKVLSESQIASIISSKNVIISIVNSSGLQIENISVDLDNLTSEKPVFADNDIIKSLDNENTLTFNVTSSSEIAYIKYDYNQVFDKDEGIKKFYSNLNDEELDLYVYSRGITASVDGEGNCTITAPKNVKSVRIVAVDKSGASAYATKDISQGIYTVSDLSSYSDNNLYINSHVLSVKGIKKVAVSYSLDGTQYTGTTEYSPNVQGERNDAKTILFKDISSSAVYVRVTASTYDGSVSTTSVTKISLNEN